MVCQYCLSGVFFKGKSGVFHWEHFSKLAKSYWLPEDSPHGRFATKICYTTGETYECDREFETVPMRKICHTTVIGWGWVGKVGIRGVEVGSWAGGLGRIGNPPTLIPRPNSPDLNPPQLSNHKPPTPRLQLP